jgi:hypothetical protein
MQRGSGDKVFLEENSERLACCTFGRCGADEAADVVFVSRLDEACLRDVPRRH